MIFLDFFSGIGGFRLGMEQAGHTCAGHCEIDRFANISYNAIHQPKEGEWFATDIRAVESGELPDADCWCGGFPCQAFSIAGKRAGFEDMRGTLIFEIFRLAAERKPRILLLENVAGLLSHDEGRTFATILCGFWELGYDVQWQVLNSKDFGVPQNRERIFIVGHLGESSGQKIFPIGESNSQTLKQLVGGCQGNRVYDTGGIACTLSSDGGGQGAKTGLYLINQLDGKLKFRDDFNCLDANYYKGLDEHQARTGVLCIDTKQRDTQVYNDTSPCLLSSCHKEPLKVAIPVLTPDRQEKRQNDRRFKEDGEPMFTLTGQDRHGVAIIDVYNHKELKDGICGTITAGGNTGAMRCGTFAISTGMAIRKLTPRECFRLQGFPDWAFDRARAAGVSDSQLYKQAGNSVTTTVVYEIARRLI